MNLNKFIKSNILPNTLVRILVEDNQGYLPILKSWDTVSMEHEILNKKGVYKYCGGLEVIGVKDVLVRDSNYPEAVNIVVKADVDAVTNRWFLHLAEKGVLETINATNGSFNYDK